jgi:hypothetical protein
MCERKKRQRNPEIGNKLRTQQNVAEELKSEAGDYTGTVQAPFTTLDSSKKIEDGKPSSQ